MRPTAAPASHGTLLLRPPGPLSSAGPRFGLEAASLLCLLVFHLAAPWPFKRTEARLPCYTWLLPPGFPPASRHHSSPVVRSEPGPRSSSAVPRLSGPPLPPSPCYLWNPHLLETLGLALRQEWVRCPTPGLLTAWKDACALGAPEPFHCTLPAHLPVGRCALYQSLRQPPGLLLPGAELALMLDEQVRAEFMTRRHVIG